MYSTKQRSTFRLRTILLTAFALASSVFATTLIAPKTASAAYDGGRLIDNVVFLDAQSMNVGQIQSFLSGMGGQLASRSFTMDCDTAGQQAKQMYVSLGAPCGATASSAQIIYYSAQVYGVSPKVIMATLQKEQSLITATNPIPRQYAQAMGYACPTTGECDSNSNFFWQIDNGTWVLRFHYERARGNNSWWYASSSWVCGVEKNFYKPNLYPGQNVRFYDQNGVLYRTHYIANAATSSFYCYTPHAYNNPQGLYGRAPYGTTGMYYSGSYNFVLFFEMWFGSTAFRFEPMEDPRWMEVAADTRKIEVVSGNGVGETLETGRHIRFVSKAYLQNQWCLRTDFDNNYNIDSCLPMENLRELTLQKSAVTQQERLMETTSTNVTKIDMRRGTASGYALPVARQIEFSTKTVVGGTTYYISQFDNARGYEVGIPADKIQASANYQTITPAWMELRRNSPKVLTANSATWSTHPTGMLRKFTARANVNGTWYYQTASDAARMLSMGFREADLRQVNYENLEEPRWMEVSRSSFKVSPYTGQQSGGIHCSRSPNSYHVKNTRKWNLVLPNRYGHGA